MNIFNRNPGKYEIVSNVDLVELRKKYTDVWKDKNIPYRQLQVTNKQYAGLEKLPAISDLIEFIRKTKLPKPTVLEVGCSTGYHIEAFRRANLGVVYEGCDYSPTFIKIAREKHSDVKFMISDATKLTYKNNQFDIVISGCCILHIIDYHKAIVEAARAAKKYVIFHRTPVIHRKETTFTKKIAYGLEMVEIFFNEGELTEIFRRNNLSVELIKTHAQMEIHELKEPIFMKDYLCRKLA